MRKALVIDDSRAMRMIPSKVLKSLEFEVLEAADGEEALKVIEDNPDLTLVLVDWRMEGMDGFDFVTNVRAREELAELPIIMITVENSHDKVLAASQAGVTDYLLKPFEKGALLAKLQRLGLSAAGAE